MAQFLNEGMLGRGIKIRSDKDGPPVEYITGGTFESIATNIAEQIATYIDQGYSIDDIQILAHSVKARGGPISELWNTLRCYNYKVHICDGRNDNSCQNNKVAISTFHQFKGKERPIVLLYLSNFGNYISKCLGYVGCSRATYTQVVYHIGKGYWKHLKVTERMRDTGCVNVTYIDSNREESKTSADKCSVTTLLEHNSRVSNIDYRDYFIRLHAPGDMIKLVEKVSNGNTIENVSYINGNVIPLIYEHRKTYKMKSLEKLICHDVELDCLNKDMNEPHTFTTNDYIEIALAWMEQGDNRKDRLNGYGKDKQYDWLDSDSMDEIYNRMDNVIQGSVSDVECPCVKEYYGEMNVEIHGRIDLITSTDIWELKTVKELTTEHFLQLLVYAWITQEEKNYKIMNTLTGEVWMLNKDKIDDAYGEVYRLIKSKFDLNKDLDNEEFLELISKPLTERDLLSR
jgi:hypothetical protein